MPRRAASLRASRHPHSTLNRSGLFLFVCFIFLPFLSFPSFRSFLPPLLNAPPSPAAASPRPRATPARARPPRRCRWRTRSPAWSWAPSRASRPWAWRRRRWSAAAWCRPARSPGPSPFAGAALAWGGPRTPLREEDGRHSHDQGCHLEHPNRKHFELLFFLESPPPPTPPKVPKHRLIAKNGHKIAHLLKFPSLPAVGSLNSSWYRCLSESLLSLRIPKLGWLCWSLPPPPPPPPPP